jgi:hypothetical protein
MMVGFGLIEVLAFFEVHGCSSSRGSVCAVAILCSGLYVTWVLASTAMGLVLVVWVSTWTRLVVSSVWVQESIWAAGVDDGGVVVSTGDWGVVMGATVEWGGALGTTGAG